MKKENGDNGNLKEKHKF